MAAVSGRSRAQQTSRHSTSLQQYLQPHQALPTRRHGLTARASIAQPDGNPSGKRSGTRFSRMPCSSQALGRINRHLRDLLDRTLELLVGYLDESGAIGSVGEYPLDGSGIAVTRPFDEDALVGFDHLDVGVDRETVPPPSPFDALTRLELAASVREPEAGGDGRIDEGIETLHERAADRHFGVRNNFCHQALTPGVVLRTHRLGLLRASKALRFPYEMH